MGIPIIGPIVEGLKAVFGFVDNLHTSDDERLNAKAQLMSLYQPILTAAVDLERMQVELQARVLQVEAQANSWLTRTWRPLVMLMFATLVGWHSVGTGLGFPVPAVPEAMWSLIQLGLGGYVIGRSAEKIVPPIVNALKGKETV